MSTQVEHRDGVAVLLVSLGDLDPAATPAQRAAAADAVLDAGDDAVVALSLRLYRAYGRNTAA
jgi:hypothetical protein